MGNKKTVLLTSMGSFSSLYAIKSLKKNGFDAIGTGIYSGEYLPQTRLLDKYYKVPYYDSPSYISTICQIVKECNVDVIVPLTDPEIDVLVNFQDEFRPAVLGLSKKGSLQLMRDKYACFKCLNNEFHNHNVIKIIPTNVLGEVNIETLKFPCIVKPRRGRSSEKIEVLVSTDALKKKTENMKKKELEEYIIQPYIQGNIVTVDVVRDQYGKCCALPREEFVRTKNGAGISVKVFRNSLLEKICKDIAGIFDVRGCVNFEFIKSAENNRFYFLESNPRFSGGISFSGMAGYDMVNNHFKAISGMHCEEMGEIKEHIFTKEYCEIDMTESLIRNVIKERL